jgi:hypothetical protein
MSMVLRKPTPHSTTLKLSSKMQRNSEILKITVMNADVGCQRAGHKC